MPLVSYPGNPCQTQRHGTFSPVFSSTCFIVFGFWCILIWHGACVHSFAHGYPVFPIPFFKETNLFPLNDLNTLVETHLTISSRLCVRTPNSIPLVYMSVFMTAAQCSEYCSFAIYSSLSFDKTFSFCFCLQMCACVCLLMQFKDAVILEAYYPFAQLEPVLLHFFFSPETTTWSLLYFSFGICLHIPK